MKPRPAPPPIRSSEGGGPRPDRIPALVPVLVAVATLLVFAPSVRNEFVTWDDLAMFVGNEHYRGLGWAELRWMWTTVHLGEYMPVTWMTFGADFLLWGLSPHGFHLTSVVIHALGALVVYGLARRLYGAVDPASPARVRAVAAGVAALGFALHPLRVEPVAWLSARGSALGGLLVLASTLAYVRSVDAPASSRARRGWLAGAVVLFGLSLLSRATNVMLPAALVVLDLYPLRRLGPWSPLGRELASQRARGREAGGRSAPASSLRAWLGSEVRPVWREKLPFVVLAALMVPLALLARADESVTGHGALGVAGTLALALFALVFYLEKTLLLGPLFPLYEKPVDLAPLAWPLLLAGGVAVAITVLLVAARRDWPAALAAWSWYVVILLPTLGMLPYGPQVVADRYTYVACVGFALLAGGGLLGWLRAPGVDRPGAAGRGSRGRWGLGLGLAVAVLAGLGSLSWRQIEVWRDSRTLWRHAVLVDPPSAIAHSKLGYVLEREGRLPEAIAHYREAATIRPADPWFPRHLGRALAYLGRDLAREGRFGEAIPPLEQAIRIAPRFAEAHMTLGHALVGLGRVDPGIEALRRALEIRPDLALAHHYLGLALLRRETVPEAIEHFQRALELRPDLGAARAGRDAARAAARRPAEPGAGGGGAGRRP